MSNTFFQGAKIFLGGLRTFCEVWRVLPSCAVCWELRSIEELIANARLDERSSVRMALHVTLHTHTHKTILTDHEEIHQFHASDCIQESLNKVFLLVWPQASGWTLPVNEKQRMTDVMMYFIKMMTTNSFVSICWNNINYNAAALKDLQNAFCLFQ